MKIKTNKGANYRQPGGRPKTKPPKAKDKARSYLRLKVWPFVSSGIAALGAMLYVSMGNNPNVLYFIALLISGCLFYATHGLVEHLSHLPPPPRNYGTHSSPPRAATLSKLNLPLPTASKLTAAKEASRLADATLTPTQIRSKINNTDPGLRPDTARNFIDLPVTWTLALLSADPSPTDDDIILYFRDVMTDDPQSLHSPVLITVTMPLKGNEGLRMATRSERFQVKGTIKEINEMGSIVLKDCSLEKSLPARQ